MYSGGCSLPWFSFRSRFAGSNLREPSVCKRSTLCCPDPPRPALRWDGQEDAASFFVPDSCHSFWIPQPSHRGTAADENPCFPSCRAVGLLGQPWAPIWSRDGWRRSPPGFYIIREKPAGGWGEQRPGVPKGQGWDSWEGAVIIGTWWGGTSCQLHCPAGGREERPQFE